MSIAENVARIRAELAEAAIAAGRDPSEIKLCAATKMNDADAVRQAITGASVRPIITVHPVNDELLSALGKITAEYGKIGSNLNQIARSLNEYRTPYPQLAVELRNAATDLATLKFEILQKVGDALGNIQTHQL